MKPKHWILVFLALCVPVASIGFSAWFKTNAQVFFMPSGSMAPTLPVGARVIGWMHAYDLAAPARNDVALMTLPLSLLVPGSGPGTTIIAKRVIGVPGDRVEFKRGVLTLNGKVRREPFALWAGGFVYDLKVLNGQVFSREVGGEWTRDSIIASPALQNRLKSAPTQPIPPDRFLVLGDNRSNSNDSHVFGLVPRSTFQGRIGQQIWPRVRSF